ncbi:MAG: hypothetical protein C0463_01045 [Idiomarina sp.]|nr:hypothetical protein [Idiomarina sp.]
MLPGIFISVTLPRHSLIWQYIMLKKAEPHGHVKDIVHDKAGSEHRVLCVTPIISEVKTLDELLGCKVTHTPLMLNAACAVIMHGMGRPMRKVMAASTALELPILYTEFGPIHTIDYKKSNAVSMTVDHVGHVNASDRDTYLAGLIKAGIDDVELARAQEIIRSWKHQRVSKYNHTLGPQVPDGRYVVVIAEPTPLGGDVKASRAVTALLTSKAQQAFPTHKLVVLRPKQYAADVLAQADAAFVHSALVGFEALLWGVPLYVEGMPFYAGWGLTEDTLPAPAQRGELAHGLAQLVHAYMVGYSRYVNPFDSQRLNVEQAIELAAKARPAALEEAQRRHNLRQRLPRWLRWLQP